MCSDTTGMLNREYENQFSCHCENVTFACWLEYVFKQNYILNLPDLNTFKHVSYLGIEHI